MRHECASVLDVCVDPGHPYVARLVDEDHDQLRRRARSECDDRWRHWSRSYSGDVALIAGWRERVGVDVEVLGGRIEPTWSLDNADYRATMMTPEERERPLTLDPGAARQGAISLWCSKEALAKALGTPLEWEPSRLGGPALWPSRHQGRWRATYLDADHVATDALAWVVFECTP